MIITKVPSVASSFLLVFGLVPAQIPHDLDRAALIGESAYVLGDARVIPVGRGPVMSVDWSDTGSNAFIEKIEFELTPEMIKGLFSGAAMPRISVSLYLWNRRSNSVRVVDQSEYNSESGFFAYDFVNNERSFISHTYQNLNGLTTQRLRVGTVGGMVRDFQTGADGDLGYGIASDRQSILLYQSEGGIGTGAVKTQLGIYDFTRNNFVPVQLQLDSKQLIAFAEHSASLGGYLVQIVGFNGGKAAWILWNSTTGAVTEMSKEQFLAEFRKAYEANEIRTPKRDFMTHEVEMKLPDNSSSSVLRLAPMVEERSTGRVNPAKPDKALYFAPGATDPWDAPNGDAVLYLLDGLAIVRDVVRLDRAAVDRVGRAETQTELMARAKQVGTALILYSTDNDDLFPPGEEMVERVLPYVKKREIFDGFIYTYKGNASLAEMDKPHEVEIGFIRGEGGSAVVYADGSVRWKPDA